MQTQRHSGTAIHMWTKQAQRVELYCTVDIPVIHRYSTPNTIINKKLMVQVQANICSAGQEFPLIMQAEGSLPCSQSSPLVLILSQINSENILTPHFYKIQFDIILPSTHRSITWSSSLRFPDMHTFPISPTCDTWYLANFLLPVTTHNSVVTH